MKQVLKFNLHLKDLSKLRNTSGDYEQTIVNGYGSLNSARSPNNEINVRLKHKQKINKSLDDDP